MSGSQNNIIGRRLVRSYLSSIVSISMVLFVTGFFALVSVNARAVSNYFKENVRISVILKPEITQEPAKLFYDTLSRLPYVKVADFISKEEGTLQMREMLGDDFLNVFQSNPIPVSIDIRVDAVHFNKDSIGAISERIMAHHQVDEVVYKNSVVEAINENMDKIGGIMLLFIAVLLVVAIALINNTVRLNLYSKRFSIYTMRLVGAKISYIRKPFLLKSLLQGAVSGLLACGALYVSLQYMKEKFIHIFSALDNLLTLYVLVGTLLFGMFICFMCTLFVVRKISSMENDDLYV